MLAGNQDDPQWWRAPLTSFVLAIAVLIAAAVVRGTAGTVLLVLSAIVGFPAVFQGLLMIAGAGIDSSAGKSDAQYVQADRRILTAALMGAVLLAVAGVVLYASDPGVGSYQTSLLLVLPLFIVVVKYLHRRLPPRIEWTLTMLLALIGCGGYLIVGGAQWWNWGQFAVFPLVLLITFRRFDPNQPQPQEPWYGGFRDGPWGHPSHGEPYGKDLAELAAD